MFVCTVRVYVCVGALISYFSSVCSLTMAPLLGWWNSEPLTSCSAISAGHLEAVMEDEACMIQTMGPAYMNTDSKERQGVQACLFWIFRLYFGRESYCLPYTNCNTLVGGSNRPAECLGTSQQRSLFPALFYTTD